MGNPINSGSHHVLRIPLAGVSGWEEAEEAAVAAIGAYTGWPRTSAEMVRACRDATLNLELQRDGRWYGEAVVET